jgi:hypothetical protein
MNTRRSWKLLPFVAVVALAAFVLVPGGTLSPRLASADIDSLTFDSDAFDSGDEVTGTVELDAETGNITISIIDEGEATNIELTLGDCSAACSDGSSADDRITISADGLTSIEFTLTAECDEETEIEVEVSQLSGGDDTAIVTCGSSAATGNITVRLDAEGGDNSDDFKYEVSTDDNGCDGNSFTLNDGDVESFDCDDSNTDFTIEQTTTPTGWTLESIECTDTGISSSDIDIDVAGKSVTFTLGAGDDIDCTFTNTEGPTATATPKTVAAETVTLSAGPNSVGCNGASFITIVVKGAGGANVSDGTTVNVTASLGSVSPSSQTTQGGGVLVLYTAPASQSGTATITATAGGKSGTTTVLVNCTTATATTQTQQQPTPVPTATGGIRPPSTGDAGLAAESGGSSSVYTSFAAVIAIGSLFGALVASRLRA